MHTGNFLGVHSTLRPPIGLLCQPRVFMMMEKLVEWWLARKTEVLGEEPAPVPLCPPQTPNAARTRTWAAAVGSQRLTALATARPIRTVTQNLLYLTKNVVILLLFILFGVLLSPYSLTGACNAVQNCSSRDYTNIFLLTIIAGRL
jgi:hypothetical protein